MEKLAPVRQFVHRNPIMGVAALIGGAAAAKGGHGLWALGGALSVSMMGFLLGHSAAALLFRLQRYLTS